MEIINIVTELEAEANARKFCKWAVCYTIDHTAPGCQQDDNRDHVQTVATFQNPFQAQSFIENCIPEETRERFYIIRIGNNYPEELRRKYAPK